MADWGPIGQQVFDRTYARTKEDGTQETWDEVIERMVDGNLALVDEKYHSPGEREDLIRLISAHKLVPAGRHWWVSGVPGRQFLFNCHRAGWTDKLADHCGFVFDELMKGGGVGCNYSKEYLDRQYRIRREVYVNLSSPDITYVIEDSREGWVDALRLLCDLSQIEGPTITVKFDTSRVRPRGAPIRGFGGTASGPEPLEIMLETVARELRLYVGHRIDAIGMMNIDHAIASCVVAGNVRRSARMSMIHWQDPQVFEFLRIKHNGGHWTTNISVELDSKFWEAFDANDEHARAVLDEVAEGMWRNGEPGIFNSTLAAQGEHGDVRCTNPCGEIALEEWENCNLGHINLARVVNADEMIECAALMARWLIRATFSEGMCFRQREVVNRNRRIGVGILGFQEWIWKNWRLQFNHLSLKHHGVRGALTDLRSAVWLEAEAYAAQLKIAFPVKVTTVAPTGTTAKLSGSTEGIHPIYSRYFVRRVRYASNHPFVDEAIAQGLPIEDDLVSRDTVVVSFPCRDSALDVVPEDRLVQADECTPNQLLTVQRVVQQYYADNAVSFTVNFDPTKYSATDVFYELATHGRHLKGTTFMPDGSYEQAPIERITKQVYEDLTAGEVGFVGSSALDCVGGACPIR